MNAIGGISPATAPNRCQPPRLASVDKRLLANEAGIKVQAHRPTPPGRSCKGSCEVWARPHGTSYLRNDRQSPGVKKNLNRMFPRLSKSRLAKFFPSKALHRSGNNLRDLRHTVVMSLNAPPLWEVGSKYKKNNIIDMYLLKNHGIEITLNDYSTQRTTLTSFSTLIQPNYIKVSTPSLDQCLKLNGNPEFLNNPHDCMVTLFHNNKISFKADRVEHIESLHRPRRCSLIIPLPVNF
ncbi:hypothetical protein [Pseudomonas mucidolens]|uniref:Uncharacterized protein n=1 Tax=Pseudomonas mucidolens TaxID=46679 RepID=A0A1H2M4B1_9PSED|nr:hypothetical protein [Pseudomonas mucidolens]SDU87731.1 hypothetical protein SAMN05216202_0958 [Pseudomonas mucidolens]SQH34624.1 Uncharacterised protein [Pseudomonas mucidolens]